MGRVLGLGFGFRVFRLRDSALLEVSKPAVENAMKDQRHLLRVLVVGCDVRILVPARRSECEAVSSVRKGGTCHVKPSPKLWIDERFRPKSPATTCPGS